MQADKPFAKLTACAVLSVISAVLGILEGFLPLELIIPVPGVKLGIANIVIMYVFYVYGAKYALAVSAERIAIVFIFTGNAVSFLMSVSGGLAAFLALYVMMKFYDKLFSFIGVSSVTAAAHGTGQLFCAYFIVGNAVIYYLPVMLIACTLTGIFTGKLMNISVKNTIKTKELK